jgi:hypothetical protein
MQRIKSRNLFQVLVCPLVFLTGFSGPSGDQGEEPLMKPSQGAFIIFRILEDKVKVKIISLFSVNLIHMEIRHILHLKLGDENMQIKTNPNA